METMVTMGTGHVGIAISALELWAVYGERRSLWRAPLEPFSAEGASWPSLSAALRELAGLVGGSGIALSVALLSPLAEVRTLELPALRDEELRSLLTRSAARYFVGARSAQLIGIAPHRRGSAHTVAAAAPARLVAVVHAAAREAGWNVDAIAPAEGAWAAAATTLWPAFARGASNLLVLQPDRCDLVQLRDGRLAAVRRFRPGAADAAIVGQLLRTERRVAAIGPVMVRTEVGNALSSMGVTLTPIPANFADMAEQPDRVAATFAGPANALVLRTDDARTAQRGRSTRVAVAIAAAAVVLILVAGVLELWGMRRELRAVQDQRAAIRPQLSVTLVGRTTVETAYRQLAALGVAERTASRWSGVLARMSEYLDDDAYLTAFRGRGDSLVVDGIATHAATVFTDLERTPGLTHVEAAAPVRRESPGGADATEHFTIAARLGDAQPSPTTSRVAR